MNCLSIIIPTLNEAQHLEQTITTLKNNAQTQIEKEVIVVDGGSKDSTVSVAEQCGVRVIVDSNEPKGRAVQLNRGAQEARGDVLMFLDADSLCPLGYDQDIQKALERKNVIGGAFDFALDGKQFGLRVVEFINRLRYNVFGLYYGDQGIFTTKVMFEKVGGYPLRQILEASDFCALLKKHGKLKLIRKPMLTSARRFITGGIYRVLGHDVKVWWLDFIGRPTDQFGKAYWEFNKK